MKKAFNDAFGSQIKVYKVNIEAEETTCLSKLGLKEYSELECRSSLTAGKFIERMAERGLKVAVWTPDYHVKVLDGLTLESTGKVKNMARKRDMEDMIAYQRKDDAPVTPEECKLISEKKMMKKYTVKLWILHTIQLRLGRLDEEGQEALDDIGGVEKIDNDFFLSCDFDLEFQTIVMHVDSFTGSATFNLEVKDEDGDVVYTTTDPESIIRYPYDDEETYEEIKAPNFKFQGVEPGTYLVDNNEFRWCCITGEIETDEFDPSKLAFFPSEIFDDMICEDDVFLEELRYDNQKLEMEYECHDDYGSDFNLLEATELNDNYNFHDYRRKNYYFSHYRG